MVKLNINRQSSRSILISIFYEASLILQKLSSQGVLQKKCSEKFRKIHRKTPDPEYLKKVAELRLATVAAFYFTI